MLIGVKFNLLEEILLRLIYARVIINDILIILRKPNLEIVEVHSKIFTLWILSKHHFKKSKTF